MSKVIWTKERILELEKDYQNIKDIKVIADKYNTNVNNLKSTLSHYQIKRGRKFYDGWSNDDLNKLRDQYDKVRNIATLEKMFGRNRVCIYKKACLLGLRRNRKYRGILFEDEE